LERAHVAAEIWCWENFQDRDRDWQKIHHFHSLSIDNFASLSEYLELAVLAVDPKYHRRDVGGNLVQWGVDTAKEECIPIVVEGSETGTKLYSKIGFKVIAKNEIFEGVHVVALKLEPESV
jgi:predicted N-acetyltransferase YhbS